MKTKLETDHIGTFMILTQVFNSYQLSKIPLIFCWSIVGKFIKITHHLLQVKSEKNNFKHNKIKNEQKNLCLKHKS